MRPLRPDNAGLPGGPPPLAIEQTIDGDWRHSFLQEVIDVPLELGAIRLVRMRSGPSTPLGPPVLLVHGFAQNCCAWHVPGRSFAGYLAAHGFDTFSVNLRGVERGGSAALASGFADYIEEDLPRALDAIRLRTGHERAFIVGHSMGGAIACGAAGRAPERVRGIITLAGLYGFARGRALLGAASTAIVLAANALRRVAALGLPMHAVGGALSLARAYLDAPLAALLPLHAWVPGSIEDAVLREYLARTFAPASLAVAAEIAGIACGRPLCDRRGEAYFERFERTPVPLLVVTGSADALISQDDAALCFERSQSPDKDLVVLSGLKGEGPRMGHVDLIMGREAPGSTWRVVRDWMLER